MHFLNPLSNQSIWRITTGVFFYFLRLNDKYQVWVQRCFKSEKKSLNNIIDCTLQAPPGALKAIQLFY